MAILSIFVFGAALAVSLWTIYATIAPQFGRIVDLLVNGPVATPALAAAVPSRGTARAVRVRGSSASRPAQPRAAA